MHQRAVKSQSSLRIRAVSLEPFESRIHKRSVVDEGLLAPTDTSACAFIVDLCIIEPRHLISNNVAF